MTPKQQRFVQEYLVDLNASAAAVRAGYATSGAGVEGARLLKNANVAAEIAKSMANRSERTEITQDMVVRELARIGFADMRKLLKWTGNATQMDMAEADENGEVQISVSNLVTLFDSDELDADTVAAISEISQTKEGALKVKLHDKQAALVNLGKHLGMFRDRIELTGKDGEAIKMEQMSVDADAVTSRIVGLVARGGAGSVAGSTKH